MKEQVSGANQSELLNKSTVK